VGYDLDESYIRLAERRVAEELAADGQDEGRSAKEIAASLIAAAGFTRLRPDQRQGGGVSVSFTALDSSNGQWSFDVSGGHTTYRPGLRRTDVLWKAIAKAAVLAQASGAPFVLLTTGLPSPGSAGAAALQQVCGPGKPVRAAIDMLQPSAADELRSLFL
jgi:hypothetical protein